MSYLGKGAGHTQHVTSDGQRVAASHGSDGRPTASDGRQKDWA